MEEEEEEVSNHLQHGVQVMAIIYSHKKTGTGKYYSGITKASDLNDLWAATTGLMEKVFMSLWATSQR